MVAETRFDLRRVASADRDGVLISGGHVFDLRGPGSESQGTGTLRSEEGGIIVGPR